MGDPHNGGSGGAYGTPGQSAGGAVAGSGPTAAPLPNPAAAALRGAVAGGEARRRQPPRIRCQHVQLMESQSRRNLSKRLAQS